MQRDEAIDRFPSLRQDFDNTLQSTRDSSMRAISAKRVKDLRNIYEGQNELSLTSNLLPLIIKVSRSVKKPGGGLGLSPSQKGEASAKDDKADVAFYEDGIRLLADKLFNRSVVPWGAKSSPASAILNKAMAKDKDQRMTTPKPDFIYGFSPQKFQFPFDLGRNSDIPPLLDFVNGIRFPFFLIEAKSDSGSQKEGKNQACRAGATAVSLHRELIAKAGEGNTISHQGADMATHIFSCVMGPTSMDIYGNFAEVLSDGKVLYHMVFLSSDDLRSSDALTALRRKLHNILDWGAEIRLPQVQRLQEGLKKAYAMDLAAAEEWRRKSKSESPKKRQRLDTPSKDESKGSWWGLGWDTGPAGEAHVSDQRGWQYSL